MADPWEEFNPKPAGNGPIKGPPPLPKAPPSLYDMGQDSIQNARDDRKEDRDSQRFEFDVMKYEHDLAKEQKEADDLAQAAKRQENSALGKMVRVIGQIGQIGLDANDSSTGLAGLGETGTSGNFNRAMPWANAGKDLAGDITSIKSNIVTDAINALREAAESTGSKGTGLGQITEREIALLEASIANIDPTLTHETFNRNLEVVRQAFLSRLALIRPDVATKMGYNPQEAMDSWIEINNEWGESIGQPGKLSFSQDGTISFEDEVKAPTAADPELDELMNLYGPK